MDKKIGFWGMIFVLGLFFGISNDALAEEGLVGLWHFDEGRGTTVDDSSANYNDGTIHGATWTEGKYGSALQFDGEGNYVDCGNDASLNITESITIEAWVNFNGLKWVNSIVEKGAQPENKLYWLYRWDDEKRNEWAFNFGNGETRESISYPSSVTVNTWYHIVATFDKGEAKIYVNGEKKAEQTSSITSLDTTGYNALIGAYCSYRSTSPGHFFNGTIDEVIIYNQALTAEEIHNHYLKKTEYKKEESTSKPIAVSNLLKNGGFEEAASFDSTLPLEWSRWQSKKETAYRDLENPYKGKASLTIKTDIVGGWQVLQQVIECEPNTSYQVTFYGKTNGLVKGTLKITDVTAKEREKQKILKLYGFEGEEWQRYNSGFSTFSTPNPIIAISFYPAPWDIKEGQIWVDEVMVVPVSMSKGGVSLDKLLEKEKIPALTDVGNFRYQLGTRMESLLYDLDELQENKLIKREDYTAIKNKVKSLKEEMEEERNSLNAEIERIFSPVESYALSREEVERIKRTLRENASAFEKKITTISSEFEKEIGALEAKVAPLKEKIVYPASSPRDPDWLTKGFSRIMSYHGYDKKADYIYRSLKRLNTTALQTYYFQHFWSGDRFIDVEKELYELSKRYNLPIIPGAANFGKIDWFNSAECKQSIEKEYNTWGKYPGFAGVELDEPTIKDKDVRNEEGYKRFREYLKNKYSSLRLKELGIINLESIIPPEKQEESPVLWTEWQYFKIELMVNYLKEIEDYLKSLRPDLVLLPVIQQFLPTTPQLCSYPGLGSQLSCIAMDPYNNANVGEAFLMELIRSASKGPNLLVPGTCYDLTVGRYARDLAISYSHCGGVWVWCWMYQNKYRIPYAWGRSFYEPSLRGKWKEGMWEVTEKTFRKMAKVEKYLINTASPSQIALIYSERTRIIDSYNRYYINQLGLYQALLQEHIQVDPVFAEALTKERINKYKVLIIPDSRTLSEREVNLIRNWVKEGGVLISIASTSLCDEWGRKQSNYLLSELFGVNYQETKTGAANITIAASEIEMSQEITYNTEYPYDLVSPTTANIIAKFNNGDPAILINRYYKGKSIFLTPVKLGLCFQGSKSTEGMFKDYYPGIRELISKLTVFALKGEELPFIISNCPKDVECIMRTQPNRYILHLLNYADEEPVKGVEIELNIPSLKRIKLFYPEDDQRIEYKKLNNKKIAFKLRDFDVHEMVVIEY